MLDFIDETAIVEALESERLWFQHFLCGLTLVLVALVLSVMANDRVGIASAVLSLACAYFTYSCSGTPQKFLVYASMAFCFLAYATYIFNNWLGV